MRMNQGERRMEGEYRVAWCGWWMNNESDR